MAERILEVKDLHTSFYTDAGEVQAVNGLTFNLERGEVLGIVGESGSGKSVTAYSIMRILTDTGTIKSGQILYHGEDLTAMTEKEMRSIRGSKISIIFQDPMTSLNPTYTVGNQIEEAIRLHTNRTPDEIKERAVEMLRLVGLNEPEKRVKQYPHELSGGMRQRVMIAMALACEPDILIADEPTTALDVTIQAQILELMQKLQKELGMAIIMITHDLGVIADMCDTVIVMYGGRVCERGTAEEIFYNPCHEYTKRLMESIPRVAAAQYTEEERAQAQAQGCRIRKRLKPISGTPIDQLNLPKGCAFSPRCECAMKICLEQKPEEIWMNENHTAACWMNVKKAYMEKENQAHE